MIEAMQRGGPLMWWIAMCSVVALAIVMERMVALTRSKINTRGFLDQVRSVLDRNRIAEAVNLCDQTPGPIASILKAGLLKFDRSRGDIQEAIEAAAQYEIPRLERYLWLLSTIAHVAPLLGLFGTVTGMVKCFQVVEAKTSSLVPVNPADLAGGIWEALLTTVAGLTVAIPAYVAFRTLGQWVHHLVNEMEFSANELIDMLEQRAQRIGENRSPR